MRISDWSSDVCSSDLVLRGAQGTLYGRNATGGSINVITADPTTTFQGFAQLVAGRYVQFGFEPAVGGPLIPYSDKVLVRIAAKADERSGWGTNQFTGNDIDDNNERAVRAKLQFQLSDRFQIKLTADYSRADDAQAPHFAGTAPNNAPPLGVRSEEHTSELQSLMRISYAVFCLKKKTMQTQK